MASPDLASGARAHPPIVVTAASRLTKRTVGLSAWAVLEDVALDTTLDTDDRPVAVTSVRRIAAHLGVSKDTVQRALTVLIAARLLAHEPERAAGRGAITRSRYRITLDNGLGLDLGTRPTPDDATPNGARLPIGDVTNDGASHPHGRTTRAKSSSREAVRRANSMTPHADGPVQLSLPGYPPPAVRGRRARRGKR